MITRDELLRIPRLRKSIERKQRRIELYETKATGGAIEYKERVQSSVNNTASDYLDVATDLQVEVERDIEELHELIDMAKELMRLQDEPIKQDIIYVRYVQGHEWVDAVRRLHWSRPWIFRKHQEILKNLKK